MAKLTINGVAVEVPNGTSALDAVFHAGFDVPYFCAHEHLSPVGACRMCLVEAGTPRKNPDGSLILDEDGSPKIFFFPKPVASCTLAVSEGMVIRSNSDVVEKAQAGMMEFTLLNHPLDCPTCDKGGACSLQDRAFEYGYGQARFEFTRRHQDKHHALSDFIVLDRERCIHCKRCVRYFEEIPGNEVLDFIERGGHTFIGSEEKDGLGNFSGNINDICPVGALLDSTSRFRGRNWEFDRTQSTCTACPVGCSIWVDARTGRLERIRGSENNEVNELWLCDAGRFGHEWVDADDRVRTPMVRRDGKLVPATWDEAAAAIRSGLAGVPRDRIGLYLSGDSTLEEGVAAERFAATLGAASLDHFPRWGAPVGGAQRPTLKDIATSDAILVVGADVSEEAPIVDLRIQEALKGVVSDQQYNHGTALADLRITERMPRKRSSLAVFAPTKVRLHDHAGIGDTYPAGGELELLRSLAEVKGNANAQSSEPIRAAAAMLAAASKPVVILGSFALAGEAAQVIAAAGRLGAKVLSIPAAPNGAGLELLGLTPGRGGHGYGQFSSLGAVLLSGVSPDPASLRGAGFLIVHDSRLTPAAQRADVVLPAQTPYEKRGTTVNLEGRFLPVATAAIDGSQAVDLIGALGALGEALDLKLEVRGIRSAQRLLADRFGLDFSALPRTGAFSGKKVSPASAPRPQVAPAGETVLLRPRMWQERMLAGAPRVRDAVGPDTLTLSVTDARRLGVRDGETTTIQAGGREREVLVRVTDAITPPTLPAFDGAVAGARVELRVAALAAGDD
jgi:NADH-quinone oxidoreductase subunit G